MSGWTARAIGSSELARVTGEERVDEAALRRDDDLGNLVSKAFDSETAAAALPPLDVEEQTEKVFQNTRILDEIAASRIASVSAAEP